MAKQSKSRARPGRRGTMAERVDRLALYERAVPPVNLSRPPGEWQTFDITMKDKRISLIWNGKQAGALRQMKLMTALPTYDAIRDDFSYWLVWPTGRSANPDAALFREWLQAQAAAEEHPCPILNERLVSV